MAKQLVTILLCILCIHTDAQVRISGIVRDAHDEHTLSYVNIGIRNRNIGTLSSDAGAYTISISDEFLNDSLTFSLIGYDELTVPIRNINLVKNVRLQPHPQSLAGVVITAHNLQERSFGLKRYHPLLHFIDASVNHNDIFEIAELMSLGNSTARLTALNLHVNTTISDSGTFRINFYEYAGGRPGKRIVELPIMQTHAIQEGWLHFPLEQYQLRLKGNVVVAIEFIPTQRHQPVTYEIKPGGRRKCFVRSSSLGTWQVPPHQYRMYLTALTADNGDEQEEADIAPTFSIYSHWVNDSFRIFVQLPEGYNTHRHYPIVYVLDANVYFPYLSDSLRKMNAPIILAGIGYHDVAQMDTFRDRDYTYPAGDAHDSMAISGGADRFYHFIGEELVPYMDKQYNTDPGQRCLMGHSLGGYCTLYVLYRDQSNSQSIFTDYVAASPSLDYHKGYLPKQLAMLHYNNGLHSATITRGTLEEDDHTANDVYSATVDSCVQLMKQNAHHADVHSQIFLNAAHMETALPTFYEYLNRHCIK